MNTQHVIEKAVFNISFGSEAEAFEQQAVLGSLIRDRLMGVVHEVFDELSPGGQVVRIDNLEVDLGDMPYHGFAEEMVARLRERLRSLLRERFVIFAEKPATGEGIVAREVSELEQLAHFLTKGCLPWNAHPEKDGTIDQMLRRVVRSKGREFAEFLKNVSRKDRVIKRLASQFPEAILFGILGELAPSRARFLVSLVDYFPGILAKNNYPSGSYRELRCFIWEVLFRELLEIGGATVDVTDLVARILHNISRSWGMDYSQLLTLLAREETHSETAAEQGRELGDIFQTLTGRLEDEQKAESISDIEPLRGWLVEAITKGEVTGIRKKWQDIVRNRPGLLRGVIVHYGKRATIRRKMASGFPDPMLRDVVHLLEPMESGFINEIVGRPELFRQARGEASEGAAGTKRRLWEFTLTYLLVERGSRFNKKNYLESMIRQMAAHDNIRYSDLLASLTGVLKKVRVPGALKGEMLDLLGEPAAETGVRRQITDDSPGADAFHEKIREHLFEGKTRRAETGKSLEKIFDELGKKHPGMLFLLFQKFTVEELRRLIRDFLVVSRQADKEVIADFVGALESFANRAGDRKSYYGQVLDRLLRNEIIDFELLLRQKIAPDKERKDAKAPRSTEQEIVDPEIPDVRAPERSAASPVGQSDKKLLSLEQRGIDRESPGVYAAEQALASPGGQSAGKDLPEAALRGIAFADITKAPDKEEEAFTEKIYIANAGLVLAAPYLPRLFTMLELTEGPAFRDQKAAERAVHLLQFMVNENTASPEYQLVLNKILCGVRTGIPITRQIDITDREKETIEGLIRGMIDNWKIIGNTSVQGFRESFLQREGRLGLKHNSWQLLVEQRAFDMLLDRIPWSFSLIKHPWMERVVQVEWR